MSTTVISTGAPKYGHDDTAAVVGYFYTLASTETPPADAYSPAPATGTDGGFVGEDGPTLSLEMDVEQVRDWNLDPVVQVKQGATATLEIPVFGWSEDQAKIVYGDKSVVTTTNGFKVVWSGELAERKFFVLELRGVNGNGRLIVDGQVQSPGSVQFTASDALRHTITVTLFKNSAFQDVDGRSGYFAWYDETAPVGP